MVRGAKMEIPKGLSKEEVTEKIRCGLKNNLPKVYSKSICRIITENVFSFFNIVNIILFILVIITGEYKNAMFIGVVIVNTIVGITQEIRCKVITDKLSVITNNMVKVIRENKEYTVSVEDIVQDDIIHLIKGCQVCADCKIVSGNDIKADESLITGEDKPIKKDVGDRLFSGSFILSGDAYVVAEKVGDGCYSSKLITEAKKQRKVKGQIYSTAKRIVRTMALIIIPAGLILYFMQGKIGRNEFDNNIIATSAAIIGMIPNGFVLFITAVYSVGSYKSSLKNAYVREPVVLECFAGIDVVCFDKTGTITINEKVRNDIPEYFRFLYKNNIDIKIISGDSSDEVLKIAKETGIKNINHINLKNMDEIKTKHIAGMYNVFSGALPKHKKWIIQMIKESGKRVAMVGDGVNDLPALKCADCAISLSTATDAAKGVSDIILNKADFLSLPFMYSEGNIAVNNVMKASCLYLNKTCYSVLLCLFTAIYTLFGNGIYPLKPIQLTIISALTVGIPSLFIATIKDKVKDNKSLVSVLISTALPMGISIAVSEIALVIFSDFGFLSAGEISFGAYFVAGLLSFYMLIKVLKGSKTIIIICLFAVFIISLKFGSVLDFPVITEKTIIVSFILLGFAVLFERILSKFLQ